MSAATLITAPQRAEPAYRGFEVQVLRARRLSPSFLRMTFTGPDLCDFGTTGLDQRIKLVLPAACGARVDVGMFVADDWFTAWRSKPDHERESLRTYTVRAVRPEQCEVDVDVVLHGVAPGEVTTRGCGLARVLGCSCTADVGPAVRWCAAARPGDPLVLIGPNARHDGPPTGIEWRPPADATTLLLAGDETAVPAICSILESLPAGTQAQAFLEVPTEHDELDLRLAAGVEVRWLPRAHEGSTAAHGSLLDRAVREAAELLVTERLAARRAGSEPEDVDLDHGTLWEVPLEARAPDGVYAWIAGEAGVVKSLRRFLVRDIGVDRTAVAFMGYWRVGRAEG
ncbi:siderophore-interacting protein [Actinotalea sp. K2]|uniref:siderophore-interacting protein n=1 Tax=Actinotalea sp. K2 TaxID=2939438 RepID=UPI002017E1CC|nr:siderophore-interacting protein [Actinotalea sp. K2]MCL3863161.1 siderophore-interacting protein [Actinotalea sp. K2]